MRAHCKIFILTFKINPLLKHLLAEDIAFGQEGVILFQSR